MQSNPKPCTCCSALGVRYHFIVLSAPRPRNDEIGDFVARLVSQDQTRALAKLRHIH